MGVDKESTHHQLLSDYDSVREDAYKVVITVSLIFAVGSMLTICLVVPAMYSHVQNVGTYTQTDIDFCDTAAGDIELELIGTQEHLKTKGNRTRRNDPGPGAGGYGPQPGAVTLFGNIGFQECPACCRAGERGPIGDSGLPGMHGNDGPNGAPGRPGTTPNASCIPERIFEPPPCLPCPQGPRGPPGHPGFPGDVGDAGIPGRPGVDGMQGPRGYDGANGTIGNRGPTGPPGDKGPTPEAHLIPGPPGEPGDVGGWGHPGHEGAPGENGFPGDQGERGWPGPPGPPGAAGDFGPVGPPGEAGPPGTPGTCVCQQTEVIVQDAQQNYHGNSQGSVYGGYRLAFLRLMSDEDIRKANGDKSGGSLERDPLPDKSVVERPSQVHESNTGVVPDGVKVLSEATIEQVNDRGQFPYGRDN